jgi:pimeloyl-ACP methyl ester carboxylesterase
LGLTPAPLVEAGFRLVGIDQPGFGASPVSAGVTYDVSELGDLVWDVADACELGSSVIMGHSWGAAIACHAAAARPDQITALVLADAGHRDWRDTAGVLLEVPLADMISEAESVRLRVADRAAVASAFEVPKDDAMVDAVMAALEPDGSGGLISRATGEVLGTARSHAVRTRPSQTWPTINAAAIPTQLLLATVPDDARADNERDGQRFARAVGHADVVPVGGASHQMITDLRDQFGTLVSEWLGRALA